ncbi:glycosyltransferase family 4 protein [Lentibacillus sp. Marseille-P4043]|uniref:glycosyltransferase family 4 protein n=1 Tax=Lentibacillus sp. Marseille-P4043 TaxID=2040293 RepID=UPI000D0B7674|nr:MraY family glycosyltransferase [Lentibacillus sp. Marseille-P4043]
MYNIPELIIAFLISLVAALLITPVVKRLAIKLNAVDKPDNNRKMHKGVRASMGGLAIFIGCIAGLLYIQPQHEHLLGIIIGAIIILVTGMLDDIYQLKPLMKLTGQIGAGLSVVLSGVIIDKITLPFLGIIYFDNISYVITILWIVAASNAINLIDGLDGLAAGVSAIALTSIFIMAVMDYRLVVVYLTLILIGSTVGFLFHNFYPAKIFMGDTGALFLGYAIAVVSILGLFKNIALFSFIIPIIVITIPIFDTILAIIRRIIRRQSIGTADKEHIHYRLLKMGYSHRASVLILYGFSAFFGLMAIVFNSATLQISLFIIAIFLIGVQIISELAGIVMNGQQPFLDGIRKVFGMKRSQ